MFLYASSAPTNTTRRASGTGTAGASANAERSLYARNRAVGGTPRTDSTRRAVNDETARVASACRSAKRATRSDAPATVLRAREP